MISGRVDYVTTPAPFASPRSTPEEGHQYPLCCEGTRLELRELPSLATLSQVISLRAA